MGKPAISNIAWQLELGFAIIIFEMKAVYYHVCKLKNDLVKPT